VAASDGGAAGAERAPSDAIVLQDLTQIALGKPFVHRAMWNECMPGATVTYCGLRARLCHR